MIVLFVRSNTGGWSKQDHFHFVHLMEQYPVELPNRRMLYMDRMLREMPHKTRTKLVSVAFNLKKFDDPLLAGYFFALTDITVM